MSQIDGQAPAKRIRRDLAVSRFSGRRTPVRPNTDTITKEGYSYEVISVGFWPGDGEVIKDAAFYAYAAPELERPAERVALPPLLNLQPHLPNRSLFGYHSLP